MTTAKGSLNWWGNRIHLYTRVCECVLCSCRLLRTKHWLVGWNKSMSFRSFGMWGACVACMCTGFACRISCPTQTPFSASALRSTLSVQRVANHFFFFCIFVFILFDSFAFRSVARLPFAHSSALTSNRRTERIIFCQFHGNYKQFINEEWKAKRKRQKAFGKA